MKRFYCDLLGVEPANQDWTSTWSVFEIGTLRFLLHAIPSEIAEDIEITSPPFPREDGTVKLIFEVKDVEGELKRIESFGGQSVRRPWQRLGEACDIVDPEGNIFQLCSSEAI